MRVLGQGKTKDKKLSGLNPEIDKLFPIIPERRIYFNYACHFIYLQHYFGESTTSIHHETFDEAYPLNH